MRFRSRSARPSLVRSLSILLLATLLPLLPPPTGPAAAAERRHLSSPDILSGQQSPARHLRVEHITTREQRSAIAATGAAIVEVGPDYVAIVATSEEERLIRALGYTVRAIPRPLDFPPADAAYHTYDELVAEIQSVAAAHPAIVELFSIGQSYEGRELWAAKISDNVQTDEDEPEALFVGHYHAREHLTVEMMLYILHMLAEEYGAPEHEQITNQ